MICSRLLNLVISLFKSDCGILNKLNFIWVMLGEAWEECIAVSNQDEMNASMRERGTFPISKSEIMLRINV